MKRYAILLCLFNLAWSIAAWIYDWPKLIETPIYIWPVMLICPIYPLLLSDIWMRVFTGLKQNQIIFSLGILGSVVYGVAAIIYYPYYMTVFGFDWLTFGAIGWVLAYGGQGLYFLFKKMPQTALWPWIIASVYLLSKTYFDYKYKTFGYLINYDIDPNALIILSCSVVIITVTWTGLIIRRQLEYQESSTLHSL